MRDELGAVRAVSWSEVLPWLMIFRTFRIALNPSSIILALTGVLLTPLGWMASQAVFAPETVLNEYPGFRSVVESNSRWPLNPDRRSVTALATRPRPADLPEDSVVMPPSSEDGEFAVVYGAPVEDEFLHVDIYTAVLEWFTAPFVHLFNSGLGLWQFGYFLSGGLWTLLLWAFLGGAITRIAVVKLGREEHVGLFDSIKHAGSKFLSYAGAPLIPLLAAVLILSPVALLGLMMIADVGVIIAGVLWVIALIAGAVATLILLGLCFGWPLLWAAIAAECSDSFDAVSRCYMYVLHRPAQYLFYVIVAALTGAFAWILVAMFAEATIELTYWAASWGVFWSTDAERLQLVRGVVAEGEASSALAAGQTILNIADGLVQSIATAFAFSFFWCATSAIYLLIRRDEDETEYDEVYLDDADLEHGLPPIQTEEPAARNAQEPPPQSEDDVQDGS